VDEPPDERECYEADNPENNEDIRNIQEHKIRVKEQEEFVS